MYHATKPPARTKDLTVLFNEEERETFRRKCAQIGEHCSTQARRLVNAWNPLQTPAHGTAPRRRREYPSHAHVAHNLPNRASRGGAPRPARF
jgi:hypothetical protein